MEHKYSQNIFNINFNTKYIQGIIYICDICQKTYSTLNNLNIVIHDDQIKYYYCKTHE